MARRVYTSIIIFLGLVRLLSGSMNNVLSSMDIPTIAVPSSSISAPKKNGDMKEIISTVPAPQAPSSSGKKLKDSARSGSSSSSSSGSGNNIVSGTSNRKTTEPSPSIPTAKIAATATATASASATATATTTTTTTATIPTISTSTATQLALHWFPDPAEDPFYADAVCNDGSPGGYYLSPSTVGDANDTFIIHLPGGGQCYDEESCRARWEYKQTSMTSTLFPAIKVKKGFMDSSMKKTPFWGATKAMLGYCSSDGYMGDVDASDATWGWHFRGQKLVFSLIRVLIARHGLSNKSTIIFSGGSAGARGVMVLIDLLVREHFPPGAKVVGFLDSPYYVDVKPLTSFYQGFQYEEEQKYRYMNTGRIISPECAARYPATAPPDHDPSVPFVNQQWKCQFGQYRLPFVQTSFFVVTSQYDSYQLQMDLGQSTPPPFKVPAEAKYAESFAQVLQGQLNELKEFKAKTTVSVGVVPALPMVAAAAATATTTATPATTIAAVAAAASAESHAGALSTLPQTTPSSARPDLSLPAHPALVARTYGLYSWSCYNHDVSSSSAFYTMTVDEGVTMKDALESFIRDALKQQKKQEKQRALLEAQAQAQVQAQPPASSTSDHASATVEVANVVHSWMDSCHGLGCGAGCALAKGTPGIPVALQAQAQKRAQLQAAAEAQATAATAAAAKAKQAEATQTQAQEPSAETPTVATVAVAPVPAAVPVAASIFGAGPELSSMAGGPSSSRPRTVSEAPKSAAPATTTPVSAAAAVATDAPVSAAATSAAVTGAAVSPAKVGADGVDVATVAALSRDAGKTATGVSTTATAVGAASATVSVSTTPAATSVPATEKTVPAVPASTTPAASAATHPKSPPKTGGASLSAVVAEISSLGSTVTTAVSGAVSGAASLVLPESRASAQAKAKEAQRSVTMLAQYNAESASEDEVQDPEEEGVGAEDVVGTVAGAVGGAVGESGVSVVEVEGAEVTEDVPASNADVVHEAGDGVSEVEMDSEEEEAPGVSRRLSEMDPLSHSSAADYHALYGEKHCR